MDNIFGALADSQFWKDVGNNARPSNLYAQLQKFGDIAHQADSIAEQEFPDSARDSSTKNAFRHALGTGLIAQHLGASNGGLQGVAAATLAKVAGYGWEGMAGFDNLTRHGKLTDTQHDLNANALGASAAMGTDKAGLIDALRKMAQQSVVQQPPSVFEPSPGYLTRTVR